MSTKIKTENRIISYIHCKKCIDEIKKDRIQISPSDYQMITAGFTSTGLQIWCNRHNCNVMNFNLNK
jgi:hypothetical protein